MNIGKVACPLFGLSLVLALARPAAGADTLALRQRITAGPTGEAREQMQYFTSGKRITDDARMRSIIDLDAKTVTMVHKDKKSYTVMTFDELRDRGVQLKKTFDNLPPQARKMLGLDASVTLKPTGKSEKIAGYQAKEYTIEGGPAVGSVWAADDLNVGSRAQEWEKIAAAMGGPGNKLGDALAQLNGVQLRTAITTAIGPHGGKASTTTEVIEVSETPPPPEVLAVPPGFTKVAAPPMPTK